MSNHHETAGSDAPSGEDYEEIVEAVMQTARGRWFLSEYARRNRTADTAELLGAIKRLESAIPAEIHPAPNPASQNADAVRGAIGEMADEIAATKREIASIGREGGDGGNIAGATAELDAVVNATETATSDILEAAEAVQEIAWTLREENVADAICDALDCRATEIYTACSFQDITGQRTQKVVRLLQMLDQRISILAKLWADPNTGERSPAKAQPGDPDSHLLNGPALGDQGVSQSDVDQMMDAAAWDQDHQTETAENLELADPPAEAANDPAAPATAAETEPRAQETVSKDNKTETVASTTDVSFEDLSQKDMDALFA